MWWIERPRPSNRRCFKLSISSSIEIAWRVVVRIVPLRRQHDRGLSHRRLVGRLDDVEEVVLAHEGVLGDDLQAHLLDLARDLPDAFGVLADGRPAVGPERREHGVGRHLAPLVAVKRRGSKGAGRSLPTALQPGDVVGLAGIGLGGEPRVEQLAGDLGGREPEPHDEHVGVVPLAGAGGGGGVGAQRGARPAPCSRRSTRRSPSSRTGRPCRRRPWRPARRRAGPPRPTRWARHREGRRARRRGRACSRSSRTASVSAVFSSDPSASFTAPPWRCRGRRPKRRHRQDKPPWTGGSSFGARRSWAGRSHWADRRSRRTHGRAGRRRLQLDARRAGEGVADRHGRRRDDGEPLVRPLPRLAGGRRQIHRAGQEPVREALPDQRKAGAVVPVPRRDARADARC